MTEINDPAVARKRRKAIIQSQRSEAEQPAPGNAAAAPSEDPSTSQTATKRNSPTVEKPVQAKGSDKKRKLEKSRGSCSSNDENSDSGKQKTKTQISYAPDVPMSKEQLAAWRREARRVRNRESAAASRQRIRNRITELEDEVADWKSKYAKAMERLETLEKTTTSPTNGPNGS